jgi:uncharacterized protein YdhG (YjbR/CyaY superfamily)
LTTKIDREWLAFRGVRWHILAALEASRKGCSGVAKAKAIAKAPASKARPSSRTVDDYLARVPEPARGTLGKIRAAIRLVVPAEATEQLSYGVPAFRYKGALVAYAAFKRHCSFFPMQASLIDEMKEELQGYRTSKGTLQFPVDQPLPAALVKKMVKARILENDARQKQ